MRLGVSPAAASTPTGVFNQRFEALFPCTGTLGCGAVCHLVNQLLFQLCPPRSTICRLTGSASCLALSPLCPSYQSGDCFFFISLGVGLPYSLIFCQFWLFFVFKFVVLLWLFKKAQCVYLCLHLGRKLSYTNSEKKILPLFL